MDVNNFYSRMSNTNGWLAVLIVVVLGATFWSGWRSTGHVEFVTLHHMAVLDMKSDKVTKGDADYKEGWACFMVRPREAKLVRSDLLPDEHGNTMLACYWKEPF